MSNSSENKNAYYASRFRHDPKRAAVWREIVRYTSGDLIGRKSLLELGCGYGDFINQVEADERYAVDINSDCKSYLDPSVIFHNTSCCDLSFLDDDSVQTIFASNLLEHLDRSQLTDLLPEILRVLTTRGRLILIQPNYRLCSANYFDDYTHVSVFSDISLCDFLSAHQLNVVKCVPGLLPFSMRNKVPKVPSLVRLYLHSPIRPMAKQMYIVAEKSER
jgi:SAM-dependent methyltransferase